MPNLVPIGPVVIRAYDVGKSINTVPTVNEESKPAFDILSNSKTMVILTLPFM